MTIDEKSFAYNSIQLNALTIRQYNPYTHKVLQIHIYTVKIS